MVREPKVFSNMTITVKLKDGTLFENMDTTGKPYGEYEKFVAFWANENEIRSYPIEQVEYSQFNF